MMPVLFGLFRLNCNRLYSSIKKISYQLGDQVIAILSLVKYLSAENMPI